MRSLLIFFFVVTLCGCTKESDDSAPMVDYVDFTVVTDVYHSRSEIINNIGDLHDISIFGYQNGMDSPFLNGLEAHRDYRDWRYSPLSDWADYNYSSTTFYAYSPCATAENGLSVKSSSNGLILNYVTPSNASCHPYILVSYPHRHVAQCVEPVRFVMQHPLVVVRFDVIDDSAIEIIVSGVVLESQLRLSSTDLYMWGDALSYGDVYAKPSEYMMMIPQKLGEGSCVTVIYADHEESYSLAGEEWFANQRVGYTIATDSLVLNSTQRRVLSL